jgi:hypothetical protein
MKGQQATRLVELCEQAANEQRPDKLLRLVEEINRLLEDKTTVLPAEVHTDSRRAS